MTDPPSPEELENAYTVDDLVRDERRHLCFMLVIFVLAAIYFMLYGRPDVLGPRSAPSEPPHLPAGK